MSKGSINSKKVVFLTQVELPPSEANISPDKPSTGNDIGSLIKKLNTVKQQNIKKASQLERLQAKAIELKFTAASIEEETKMFELSAEAFRVNIENAKAILEEEVKMKKVYEHMLSRNKSENTRLDVRVNKVSEDLKSAKLRMDMQSEKARKAKDKKYGVKNMMQELKTALEVDANRHLTSISVLENSIVKRRELVRRYDERSRRQAEIIEFAAKCDKEAHEKRIRQRIIMNKMLFEILAAREKGMKAAGQGIEKAYYDIKAKTGLSDPKDILNKFIIREETHNHLITSVENSEVALESLRNQYRELKSSLKTILLITESEISDENLQEKQEKISVAYKTLDSIHEQHRKTSAIHREVKKWTRKIGDQLNLSHSEDIPSAISAIDAKLTELIEQVRGDPTHFTTSLKKFESKSTKDIVREIQKSSPNPRRSRVIN